jgi:hypothetical protein
MKESLVKASLIIAGALIICSLIFMYPTYRCMMIAADGAGSEIICMIKQN